MLEQDSSLFTNLPQRLWAQHPVHSLLATLRTHVCWCDWLGSRTCACSCMLSQTTAGRPRFAHSSPLVCSRSLRLYFETHMPAVTQHVPILSDLVLGSVDRSATRPFLNLKWWNQKKVCCAHSLQSDWVLTQFSLGSGSLSLLNLQIFIICQYTDLCPCLSPCYS